MFESNGNVAVQQNDVWGTLTKSVSDVFAAREQRKYMETLARTKAAPSGEPNYWFQNPLPGLFSAYPQADTKAVTQSPSGMSIPSNMLWLILAGLLVLLLFVRRGR